MQKADIGRLSDIIWIEVTQVFRDDFTRELLAKDKATRKEELARKRMEDLDKIIQRLCEDSVLGKLKVTFAFKNARLCMRKSNYRFNSFQSLWNERLNRKPEFCNRF